MPVFRLASALDSDPIVEIIRSGVPEQLLPYTTFNCAGYHKYVLDTIHCQQSRADSVYIVAAEGEKVTGFAEIRRDAEKLFLNNIYVVPYAQSKGTGRLLLYEGLCQVRDMNQGILELDVFADNQKAKEWYFALGLTPISNQLWVDISLSDLPSDKVDWWVVSRMPQANAVHEIYGFSEFVLLTPAHNYMIGRLGTMYFRSTTSDILEDLSALVALRSLDSQRRLFCVGSPDGVTRSRIRGSRVIASSIRLRGDLDSILMRLRSRIDHKHY